MLVHPNNVTRYWEGSCFPLAPTALEQMVGTAYVELHKHLGSLQKVQTRGDQQERIPILTYLVIMSMIIKAGAWKPIALRNEDEPEIEKRLELVLFHQGT